MSDVQRADDGRIIGYRVWMLMGKPILMPVLGGLFLQENIWMGPVTKAVCPLTLGFRDGCVGGSDDVPHKEGTCGLYACKTVRDLINYLSRSDLTIIREWNVTGPYGIAFGPVYLWGKIVEHKYGYRAQYAQVGEPLVVMEFGSPTLWLSRKLGHRYGVRAICEECDNTVRTARAMITFLRNMVGVLE